MDKKYKFSMVNKFAILFISCTLLSLTSCKEEEKVDEGLPLPVVSLKEQNASKGFEYIGSIEGVETVEIRPQVDGILEEIYVDEGDYYRACSVTADQVFKIQAALDLEAVRSSN